MKTLQKVALMTVLLAGVLTAGAQENPDTSYWSQSGKVGLTFSQVGLSNWASGGDPSVSFNGILNYSFKYEKSPHLWQTLLDAGYGTQRIGNSGKSFKKTDDNLVFITRYGYRIGKKWYASAIGSFRTQFFDGFKYEEDSAIFLSGFMSPAYSKVGLGVTYNHKFSDSESFSFTFSPLNGKTTFVLDDSLSSRGEYGVEPGKKVRFRGGLDLMITLKKELIKNITLNTTLSLFTPYEDMGVTDVNWDLALWFKINEFFSANISTQMIYDQDVNFVNDAGQSYNSAVQFKEVLGIGLTYSF
jgi:hypothetical protein